MLDSTLLALESQCQTSWPQTDQSWKPEQVPVKKIQGETEKYSIATNVL